MPLWQEFIMFQSIMYEIFKKTGDQYTEVTIADRKIISFHITDEFFKLTENMDIEKIMVELRLRQVLNDYPNLEVCMELYARYSKYDFDMIFKAHFKCKEDFITNIVRHTAPHGKLVKFYYVKLYLED